MTDQPTTPQPDDGYGEPVHWTVYNAMHHRALDAERDLAAERAAHEEHRRWLASLFDLPSGADWLTVARGVTEARQLAENMQGRATAMETRADTAEAKLARVRDEVDRLEAAVRANPTNPDFDGGYLAPLRHIRDALGDDQPAGPPKDTADRIVAYRTPSTNSLLCTRCPVDAGRRGWVALTFEDLPDGGICANCGTDVLAEPEVRELPLELDGAALWAAIRDHAADDHAFWNRLTRVRQGTAAHTPQDRQP